MRHPASRVLTPASLGEAQRTAQRPSLSTTGVGGDRESHRILMPRTPRGGLLARKPAPRLRAPRERGRRARPRHSPHLGRPGGQARAGQGTGGGGQVPRTKRGGSDTLNTNHLYLCILRLLHLRSTPRHPLRNPLWSPTPTSSWPGGTNVLRWHPPAETFQTRARKCYHSSHLRHLQEERRSRVSVRAGQVGEVAGRGTGPSSEPRSPVSGGALGGSVRSWETGSVPFVLGTPALAMARHVQVGARLEPLLPSRPHGGRWGDRQPDT